MSDPSKISNWQFLFRLFDHIIKELEIENWKLVIWDTSFCDNTLKMISIASSSIEGEPWYYIKERLLHEIAHIGETRLGSAKTHHSEFFRRYGQLYIRFADIEPSNFVKY